MAGLGRLDEALRDFDRSQQDAPNNAWSDYNCGLVFHHQGLTSEAAAHLTGATLRVDGGSWMAG